jgi:hypothetical protein
MNKFIIEQKVSRSARFEWDWNETITDPILFRGTLQELKEAWETRDKKTKTFCKVPYHGEIINFYTLEDWFEKKCANK